jgi:hypothetical protein
MAKCDQGYLCVVCGQDVPTLAESDLYLRLELGEVQLDDLATHAECHIRCNPCVAQYIVADEFVPVLCPGPFDKRALDADYVADETARVTAAWRRLQSQERK